ncbi:hypothetical protein SeLEV6574_g01653 [Synchytrium endobioticum]|uniref:Uncharacterized protein n=1 Tax=Synchytrium endobioticum TaxID=286115 RepID=A0A507DCC5_9FUNG|nr:hypothetical protein SeLEV6574_g01653 [Synchytrium endobioticum]
MTMASPHMSREWESRGFSYSLRVDNAYKGLKLKQAIGHVLQVTVGVPMELASLKAELKTIVSRMEKRRKLFVDENQRRLDEGLCLYCESPEHVRNHALSLLRNRSQRKTRSLVQAPTSRLFG